MVTSFHAASQEVEMASEDTEEILSKENLKINIINELSEQVLTETFLSIKIETVLHRVRVRVI